MAIIPYQIKDRSGVTKKLYLVTAEGINKYTGKRVQKKRRGITSELKAERIYRELWSQCREDRPDGPTIDRFGQLRLSYFEYIQGNIRSEANPFGISPHVERSKRSVYIHLKEWDSLHLDLITPHFVTTELDTLEIKGTATRILTANIQKEIKCLFSYAVERGVFKNNPLAALKKRRVPKKKKAALTHEEVSELLLQARRREHPYYFIWLLSLTLGLRRSELAGLKWTDIDFDNGLIYLTRQNIPREGIVLNLKSLRDRTVAVPASVIPVLKEYRLKAKTEFVIEIECDKWHSGRQSEVVKEFCKLIGIKVVTHHQLRATHITLALIDGVPLGIVKENVGHSKLSTTDEYFRSSGIQMRGQTDGLKIRVPVEQEAEVIALNTAQ